jgi:hypothetical protein
MTSVSPAAVFAFIVVVFLVAAITIAFIIVGTKYLYKFLPKKRNPAGK